MDSATTGGTEKLSFQAEVGRLLDIVAHSLYSDRRVFLRELISNASDACDRLRYEALTKPELAPPDTKFRIELVLDKAARTLTVADNGIGMNRAELIENLGTIARSGTAAFVKSLTGDKQKDVPLIGQFGVGFYSAFMVADKVTVETRRAGENQGWRWTSDGKGEFTVDSIERGAPGTSVILHVREDADEFLDPENIRGIVRQYSDHISLPILLGGERGETLNRASALWMRPKGEITAEQYKEFYHHVGHAMDDPWLTIHWRAEGKIEYAGLLYIPSTRPFDLYHPERRHGVKLYVKRVFITDGQKDLLPGYLRFLRGVVDSEDLPLNISREMLQNNPVLALIRNGVVSRVLGELDKKAKDAPDEYAKFWDNFGSVLKEGLYEDPANRERLFGLARFASTHGAGLHGLADYVGRMKPGQDAIYYIAGDDVAILAASPQLEGFKTRGVEVLLLADPVDEFWVAQVGGYQGKVFKSVTRGAADLSKISAADKVEEAKPKDDTDLAPLLAMFRLALSDAVKDVRVSERLTDSPVCLVADDTDLDIHLERMLRLHKQINQASKRILEINPTHPLVKRLVAAVGKEGAADAVNEAAFLLLDQARLLEGEPLPDVPAFARRMTAMLGRGLG
ncbi:MAG: molecular chaperone HtpG [Alphaproteobacteria bacterium]|nr:molecular chaperone HtpG [Alphaproteobacteria bacterium]